MSYRAPIAPMVVPSRRAQSAAPPHPRALTTTPSDGRSKTPHRHNQSAQTFQAQADAGEIAQVQHDPNYPYLPPVKRKCSSGDEQPTTRRWPRTRHTPYAGCKVKTQRSRDRYIAQIRRHWGSRVEVWIPKELMPHQYVRHGVVGERAIRPLMLKDWGSPLLEELSKLAVCFTKQPAMASRALSDATRRDGRPGTGGPISKDDVTYAIEAPRRMNSATPSTVVNEGPGPEPYGSPQWMLAETEAGSSIDCVAQPSNGLVRRSRPPSSDEPPVKQESGVPGGTLPSAREHGTGSEHEDSRGVSKLDVLKARSKATQARLDYLLHRQQEQERRQNMREQGTRPDNAIEVLFEG